MTKTTTAAKAPPTRITHTEKLRRVNNFVNELDQRINTQHLLYWHEMCKKHGLMWSTGAQSVRNFLMTQLGYVLYNPKNDYPYSWSKDALEMENGFIAGKLLTMINEYKSGSIKGKKVKEATGLDIPRKTIKGHPKADTTGTGKAVNGKITVKEKRGGSDTITLDQLHRLALVALLKSTKPTGIYRQLKNNILKQLKK